MAQEWEDRSSVDRGVAVLEQARQALVHRASVAQEWEYLVAVYPSSDHQAAQQPRVRYLTFARAVVWSSCRKQRAQFRHSIRPLFFEFGARSGGMIGINERKSEPLAPLECRAKIQSFGKMIGRRKLQRAIGSDSTVAITQCTDHRIKRRLSTCPQDYSLSRVLQTQERGRATIQD